MAAMEKPVGPDSSVWRAPTSPPTSCMIWLATGTSCGLTGPTRTSTRQHPGRGARHLNRHGRHLNSHGRHRHGRHTQTGTWNPTSRRHVRHGNGHPRSRLPNKCRRNSNLQRRQRHPGRRQGGRRIHQLRYPANMKRHRRRRQGAASECGRRRQQATAAGVQSGWTSMASPQRGAAWRTSNSQST